MLSITCASLGSEMPYALTSFGDAKQEVADRLGDSKMVFWKNAEIGRYISEALRCWGAHTGYWRERGAFGTTPATAFYDLRIALPALRGETLKDSDLQKLMEYQLIEPPVVPFAGTEMFTQADFTGALQRRRNQFLLDAGIAITHTLVGAAPPPIGRIPLPQEIIDIRRLAFQDANGFFSYLSRADEFGESSFDVGWPQNPEDPPERYSIAAVAPIQVQLMPPPLNNGRLDVLAVNIGSPLDPIAGVLLGVPDDLAWVLRWGALADLLSRNGPAADLGRAAYCEQRYQQGVELARISASVILTQVNDVPVSTDAVWDWDTWEVGWQNSSGQPDAAAMAGLNLLALKDVPDAGPYGITCDVVRKAPIPAADGDFLQLGEQELNAVLGYAQHEAAFKQGGAEFQATIPLYENFARLATVYNERLRAAVTYAEVLGDRAIQQEKKEPRREGVQVG